MYLENQKQSFKFYLLILFTKNFQHFSKIFDFVKKLCEMSKKNVSRQKIHFFQNPCVQTFIITRGTFTRKDFHITEIFGEIHFFLTQLIF